MNVQAIAQSISTNELSVIDRVRAVAKSQLRPIVGEIDLKGRYPEEVLHQFGAAGAFAQHHEDLSGTGAVDLISAIEAMAAVAEDCGSTAFCTWCQDACGWYLQNTENTSLRDLLRREIASGRQLGGTGLSNPMKMLSGIEPLKLSGRRVSGGYAVNGILPWVSSVQDGHYFAVVFADADDDKHALMALVRAGENGVELRHNARFMALEGTATRAATFKNAFIADEAILADPAETFARRIRPGFVLLQTGLSLGLTRVSIRAMREQSNGAGGSNAFVPIGPGKLEDRLGALEQDIYRVAATPLESEPEYRKAVLTARLEAAELALTATHGVMLYAGASGYVEGAAANRRLREAYFLAILTPAIKHLRKDLAAL
jgi:hypothetical protein